MFFMMGIFPEEKQLDFTQTGICPACGRLGRYEVFRTCSCLSLFFIPIWRWGKQYRVRMNCCGAVYALDAEIGRRIARGEAAAIRPEDLDGPIGPAVEDHFRRAPRHRCRFCGYETDENFDYCPKCGRRFED